MLSESARRNDLMSITMVTPYVCCEGEDVGWCPGRNRTSDNPMGALSQPLGAWCVPFFLLHENGEAFLIFPSFLLWIARGDASRRVSCGLATGWRHRVCLGAAQMELCLALCLSPLSYHLFLSVGGARVARGGLLVLLFACSTRIGSIRALVCTPYGLCVGLG